MNLWKYFELVLSNQYGIICLQRNLSIFTTSFDYLAYVVPYIVVAPLYFNGSIDLGSITQASEAFYNVREDFTLIVTYFEDLSVFSAGMNRLHLFLIRLDECGWKYSSANNSSYLSTSLSAPSTFDSETREKLFMRCILILVVRHGCR
jgi:putative ATP-binding cassette transporter